MKKIMIAAVAAVAGIAANAASINWQVNVMQSSPSATVGAGWVIQVYESSVEFDYAKAASGEITPWASGASIQAGTTFRATGTATQDNGTTKDYYMVVFDNTSVSSAKNYLVSSPVTVTTSEGGASVNASFGSMSGSTLATNKFYGQSWTAATPEPTSGLLLLLGMAGLALKRKRA